MLDSCPPRRDPRLLVLVLGAPAAGHAAVDAWEVRSLGRLPSDRRVMHLALWRLVTKARPSHLLVVFDARARPHPALRIARQLAVRRGLPLATVDRRESAALAAQAPEHEELLRTYPEIRHLAAGPRDPAFRTVRIALGALLTRSLPPRRYVSRITSRPAPPVDA